MPRTIIDIPETQLHDLDARCASLGISRAEAIRRAVEAFLRESASAGAFGLWDGLGVERARRQSTG
jgi:metal-responsive CopG/Arc/MetJ family transcriptional regulator